MNSTKHKGRKSSVASLESLSNEQSENEIPKNATDATETSNDGTSIKPEFKYLIVTGHNDSSIKIWNENVILVWVSKTRSDFSCHENAYIYIQGVLVNQMPTVTSATKMPSEITSICSSSNYAHLFTSDSSGYITKWSLSDFLGTFNLNDEIDVAKNVAKLRMVVCWRAHLTRIVRVVYAEPPDFLFSASIDESIRYTKWEEIN